MDAFFEKKFITTKNAEDISGYTSDYLARLARLGKISAKRIGHSWFIEKESLAQFMEQQENRKVDHIRTLTREREEEYSLHQDSRRGAAHNPLLKHVTRNFINPVPISVPQFFVLESSLRSQVRAALVALVIITSSAFVAQAMTSSSVTRGASRFVNEISSVVGAKFGSVPEYDLGVTTVSAADTQVRDSLLLVTDSGGIAAFASNAHDVTSLVFKDLNFSSIQTSFRKASEDVAKAPTKFASRIHTTPILSPNEIVQAIRSSGVAAYSIITTPSVIARALGHSYIVIGTEAYGIINKSFSGYQDIVAQSGVKTFDAAITARDSLALMPSLITRMNLAFGNAVINAAHFAIKADVSLAYWVARTAPESAQTAFMVIGSVGDVLARAADRTPSLATALFLRTTAVPAVLAPEISKNIVEAGYEGAIHFVRAANFISEGYLSTILGAGRLAHEGVTGAVKVVHAASLLAVSTPSFLEDVYLGALGKAALALESSVSQNPAHEQGLLAVVLPTLSIGEQAALFTYEAVHSLFASTSEVLAGLLGSSSDVSIVSNPPSVVLPFATSTVSNAVLVQTSSEEDVIQPVQELVPIRTRAVISSTAAQPTTINSYPTYTTVVRGVSEDLLNQSLASLRTGVLATVAGMIQPVAAQTVTNSTTIQQVNMIQDLSNLIVRNGDFRGGTLANATSVSATTGTFSSLAITGSGTTTASAGIDLSSGCFAVNGTCITTGGGGSGVTSLAATYPLLTTGATGGITISTAFGTTTANSFSSLQQFNANASTTQLTTTGATYLATLGGNVGIGTTTPGTLLSLGNTGANTVNISATATSTFGSGINVLTGCLAVNGTCVGGGSGSGTVGSGTTGQFPYYAANGTTLSATSSLFLAASGNVGIGTTSPWANLSVGSSNAATLKPLFVVASSSSSVATSTLFVVNGDGNVGIGTASPTSRLTVLDGDVELNGGYNFVVGDTGGLIGAYAGTLRINANSGASTIEFGGTTLKLFNASTPYAFDLNSGSLGFTNGTVGVGTTTPLAKLDIAGTLGSQSDLFNVSSTTATDVVSSLFRISAGGNVGIGTTTPGTLLSLGNTGANTVNISATATSTFGSGINVLTGCLAVNGTCVSGAGGGVTAVTGTWPIISSGGSTPNLTWGGLATSSPLAAGGALLYATGVNTVASVATSTLSVGTGLTNSGTLGYQVGGSAASISFAPIAANSLWVNATGGSAVPTAIATSSLFQTASASASGIFSSTDWSTFNNKQAALTFTYPLINTANTISTAFGTTTANSFNSLQQFNANASTTQLTTTGAAYLATTGGNVGVGTTTPTQKLDVAGFINTDQYSGYKQAGNTVLYASTTNASVAVGSSAAAAWMAATSTLFYDTAVGEGALGTAPTADGQDSNSAFGYNALFNTIAANNTAIGKTALYTNSTGVSNTASGVRALYSNSSGGYNTATGNAALYNSINGSNNSADGVQALYYNTASNNVSALGYAAAQGTGSYSNQGGVYVGSQSGYSAATGSDYNTFLGYQAGYNVTSGGYNIIIGQNVDAPVVTGNQQLNIGNLIYGTSIYGGSSVSSTPVNGRIGIGTTTPWAQLSINPNGISGPAFAIGSSTATNFVVTNGGNVGIGTTLPAGMLHVQSATSGVVGLILQEASGQTADVFQFQDSTGAVAGVINNLGNLGLGTTTPWGLLSVNPNGITGPSFVIGSSTATNFVVTNGGNVGIGTTTPWRKLSIEGSSDLGTNALAGYFTATSTTATTTLAGFLDVNGTGTNATSTFAANLWIKGSLKIGAASLYLTDTGIRSTDGTVNITSGATAASTVSGYFGIGTTSPYRTLSVAGSGVFTGGDILTSTLTATSSITAASLSLTTALPVSSGGTGQNTFSSSQLLYGNGTGALASVATSTLSVGTGLTNSGTLGYQVGGSAASISFAPIAANSLWVNATGGSAVPTAIATSSLFQTASASASGILSSTDWSTFNNKQAALTFTYPLINTANTISTAFGTTTANSFSSLQQFNANASTTQLTTTGSAYLATTGGSVGIGTTTPTSLLTVAGSFLITTWTNITNAFSIKNSSGNTVFNVDTTATQSQFSVGTSTPYATVTVWGAGTGTGQTFSVVNNASTTLMQILDNGSVGVGTTTPGTLLSLGNTGANTINISPTATSTFGSGINIRTGCFAVNGACVGGGSGSGTVNSGTIGQFPYYAANGTTLSATSSLFLATSGNVGIGTTTPWAQLSINPNGISGPAFAIGSSTATNFVVTNGGNVGIGTASPTYKLHVVGPGTGQLNAMIENDGDQAILNFNAWGSQAWHSGSFAASRARGTKASPDYPSSGDNLFSMNMGGWQGSEMATDNGVRINFQADGTWTSASTPGMVTFSVNDGTTAWNGGAQSMVFRSTGNLGIGEASPGSRLSVSGGATVGASYDTTAAPTNGFLVEGNTGIGTTSPATLFEVGGSTANVTLDGYKNCTGFTSNGNGLVACTASDQRLKQDVTSLGGVSGLAAINALNPVSFYWKPEADRSSQQQFGLIAQQVQSVYPNLVTTSSPTLLTPDGTLSVNYEGLISPMILAIQQLDARTNFIQSATTSTILTVDVAGNIGIGTTSPNHALTVVGDIAATAFVNTSTRSAKTDISYVTEASTQDMYKHLMNLKVATYRYGIESQNDPLRLGLIAEDAQMVAPEILSVDGNGVDIYKLATFTLSGVQTLAAKVDADHLRVTALEDRVAALESGAVSSATGSPISLSTTSLASALNSFGVVIQKGIAQFDTLVARQFVASKDADGTSSAGTATILAGNTVVQVNNSLVKTSTKVFVTFNSQINGNWWVSDKTDGSFRVTLSTQQSTDVSFDYFLIQTEGQLANAASNQAASTIQSGSSGTTLPTITLLGDNPMRISVGSVFSDPGVMVVGSADGTNSYVTFIDGTERVVSSTTISTASPATYIITYMATNAVGDSSTVTRSVMVGDPDGTVTTGSAVTVEPSVPVVSTETASSTPAVSDTTPPEVTLLGAAAIQINEGDMFTDPGATAADDTDGDVTAKIVTTGLVDVATPGLYTLTYAATDAAGNKNSASRVVTVVALPESSSILSTLGSTATSTP